MGFSSAMVQFFSAPTPTNLYWGAFISSLTMDSKSLGIRELTELMSLVAEKS